MSSHHLELNPDKAELLYFPGKSCLMHLTISIDNSLVASVGVILASPTSHCSDCEAGYGSPAWRPRAVKIRVRFGTGDRPIGETGSIRTVECL